MVLKITAEKQLACTVGATGKNLTKSQIFKFRDIFASELQKCKNYDFDLQWQDINVDYPTSWQAYFGIFMGVFYKTPHTSQSYIDSCICNFEKQMPHGLSCIVKTSIEKFKKQL